MVARRRRAKMRTLQARYIITPVSYLHTVIVLVSHDDSSLAVTRHPCWTIKLTGPGAQRAELVVEGAARLEYLQREEKAMKSYSQNKNFSTTSPKSI